MKCRTIARASNVDSPDIEAHGNYEQKNEYPTIVLDSPRRNYPCMIATANCSDNEEAFSSDDEDSSDEEEDSNLEERNEVSIKEMKLPKGNYPSLKNENIQKTILEDRMKGMSEMRIIDLQKTLYTLQDEN